MQMQPAPRGQLVDGDASGPAPQRAPARQRGPSQGAAWSAAHKASAGISRYQPASPKIVAAATLNSFQPTVHSKV